MTTVRASLRYLRMSPRKVRLVVDSIRGMTVDAAERQLLFSPKQAARPVLKLLRSAIANAEHNFKLHRKDLIIATIVADGGPVLKRFQPRAFGSAAAILKRSTHVMLVLDALDASKAKHGGAGKGKEQGKNMPKETATHKVKKEPQENKAVKGRSAKLSTSSDRKKKS